MEISLTRNLTWPRKATLGKLIWPGGECFTLEDALILEIDSFAPNINGANGYVISKIPGLTAIPQGRYRLVNRHSTRFGRILPALLDVPRFTGILIHAGNKPTDTEGCILLGSKIAPNYAEVWYSQKALEKFMAWFRPVVAKEPVWLTIK